MTKTLDEPQGALRNLINIFSNETSIPKVKVIKKDGTKADYDITKVINAINKSAARVMYKFTDNEIKMVCNYVNRKIKEMNKEEISICDIHNTVEAALDVVNPNVAKNYRDYRNYKTDFVGMLDKVYQESQRIMYIGDKENANSDSALVSTKRSLIFNELNKQLYKKFFLTTEERQAARDGYIYIHDMSARRDTMNCCLFDVATVLKGGFEMGNIWYNEPKSLDVAFDVVGDIVMAAASQQYGGFTVPEVDKILAPYAEKSYEVYYEEAKELMSGDEVNDTDKLSHEYAMKKVQKDFEQGFQGWEYKFNTVASSRGDYPFITVTTGLGTSKFEKMATIACLKVRQGGQGKKENKKPVLFPKIVFLYDKNLHGKGKPCEDLYHAGVECSKKTMYPDWLSLTGDGYVASMYKKYGRVVSPMGCRAFLSPWFEKGGFEPADETDKPIFVGRFNIGAVSLHLPMIYAKARQENKDFYEVLDYYMEMIRNLHKRTYDYLGEMRASVNPLAYCEGGFLGGHLKPKDKIKPLLKSATASFGITALNELQQLHNGKSLVEDGQFAIEVMEYINKKVAEFKAQDGWLYALYGTPAENLCFAGDSLISTISGYKPISEVKEGDLVYSYNEETKKIELKPVLASKQTQEHAVVVKVTTDNGQEFICTPEHPFAVRCVQDLTQGSKLVSEYIKYVPAKDLKSGMRLKSSYTHVDKDGRTYFNSSERKNYRHIINANYKYGNVQKGFEVHHIDHNKQNDSLHNLQLLTTNEHRSLHYDETLGGYQFVAGKNPGADNAFYGKKHTEEAKAANRAAHIGKSIVRLSLDYKPLEHFECADDAEKAGYTRHSIVQCCKGQYKNGGETKRRYKDSYWFYEQDCKQVLEANHKVVSVEYLQELIPVYNIEVADNNNYYVGGDEAILVHNCGLQVKQFRAKYGIIENVSDKPFVSNSFHCHVSEDITPIQKQNLEGRFWDLMNGGKIQYVRYPISYNTKAIETLIDRAMEKGFYEGVNLSLAYCDDCGHQELEMDVCPKCGSRNLTKIDRMNGYLAYSRINGDSRLADHKMEEIKVRKSM